MDFSDFVLAASVDDLSMEPRAREHADAIEFRMDLATEPSVQLAGYEGELPIIATNRAEWEGGDATDDGRLARLDEALAHPAVEAIDIEVAAFESREATELVERANDRRVTVIASSHEFEGTPPLSTLTDRLDHAATLGDVGKLAVMAHDPDDVLALLRATWMRSSAGETIATMAMGPVGRHSRAICPLYGSTIGYAPIAVDAATAPGQIALERLASVIETLR